MASGARPEVRRAARGGRSRRKPADVGIAQQSHEKSAGPMATDSRAVTRDAPHLEVRDTLPTARVADMDMADMLSEVLGVVERRETRATSGFLARQRSILSARRWKNLCAILCAPG